MVKSLFTPALRMFNFRLNVYYQEKMKDFKVDLEEKRSARLAKRKEQRKEERRQKWLKEKAEEEQRRKDEELKKSEYYF